MKSQGGVNSGGQGGFEPVQHSSFEIGQGIGNLSAVISKRVRLVSEIKVTLGQEGLQFSGVRTIKWVRLPDLGKGQCCFGLLANLLKPQAREGWSSDITMEVLGASLMAVTGSPPVSTGALPARAEIHIWWGGMMIQGVSSNILLSVRTNSKRGACLS